MVRRSPLGQRVRVGAAGWWRFVAAPRPWDACVAAGLPRPAAAQFDAEQPPWVGIPPVPKVPTASSQPIRRRATERADAGAGDEIQYDYTNKRVFAVGNVQIYYTAPRSKPTRSSTTRRPSACAPKATSRLTEADGKITYGEIMDLSDDFRDGFVNSLRLETADKTRMAAPRADRSRRQLHGVPERRLHRLRALQGRSEQAAAVAGQGGADDPRRQREDDLFRGRAPRILRRAAGLLAVSSRRPIRRSSARPAS